MSKFLLSSTLIGLLVLLSGCGGSSSAASLVDVGYLSVNGLEDGEYPDSLSRRVISGVSVYFINGTDVFSALWNDPFNQVGPH